MAYVHKVLFLTFLLWGCLELAAQSPTSTKGVPAGTIFLEMLHTAPPPVTIRLTAHLDSLRNARRVDQYQRAVLGYQLADGKWVDYEIKVKLRGRFRRMKCDFPPLKLNFDKDELQDQGFAKHDKLKLVTHCVDSEEAEQTLIREWLCYQLYQKLTPISYQSCLVEVVYQDMVDTSLSFTQMGVLLESTDELAQRLGGEEREVFNPPDSILDPHNQLIHDLFQFMIGNRDYEVRLLKNVKLIENKSAEWVHIVPYDFDFCSLVDAPYARPLNQVGKENIWERPYQGHKQSEEVVEEVIQHFYDHRKELLTFISDLPLLNGSSRGAARSMIKDFYRWLKDQKAIERTLVK